MHMALTTLPCATALASDISIFNITMHVVYHKGGGLIGDLNRMTCNNKLSFQKFEGEMHLPGHSFTGPGTRLDLRLNDDGTP
jgi:hypothetical protein